jgi:hypothetical protein
MSLFCPDVVALLQSLGLDEQPAYDPAVPLLQRNAIDGSHNSTPVKLLTWCMAWVGRRGRETPPSSSTPGRRLPFSRFGRFGSRGWGCRRRSVLSISPKRCTTWPSLPHRRPGPRRPATRHLAGGRSGPLERDVGNVVVRALCRPQTGVRRSCHWARVADCVGWTVTASSSCTSLAAPGQFRLVVGRGCLGWGRRVRGVWSARWCGRRPGGHLLD